MVGPTASVLMPCVSPIDGVVRRATRIRTLCGLLLSLVVLLPSAARGQGPGAPIQQAGFGGPGMMSHHRQPYSMHPPGGYCSGGNCPEVTFEYVPHDDRAGQHLQAAGEAARQLWYRLEYLNWTIEAPGDYPLGANRLSGDDAGPFDAVDIVASGFATQPNAAAFDLKKNNGIRMTLGATTEYGDIEGNFWALEQADSKIVVDPIRRFDLLGDPLDNTVPNFFAATIMTVDGQLSDTTMLLYDQSYQASLKTDVFGTEANFVFNPVTPNQPLTFRPIVGFQYINYRENLLIAGADLRDAMDPADPTATVLYNHRIDAGARNNIYAPQIGVRAEFVHEWFTIGVTPKFMMGLNRREDQLRTAQLLSLTDRSFDEEQATEVSPGLDLKVDARVHLNEHFSLFCSYQLYVLSNISRPTTNINYDTIGGIIADFNLNTSKQHQVVFDGITVGGELRFH